MVAIKSQDTYFISMILFIRANYKTIIKDRSGSRLDIQLKLNT